MTGWLRSRAFDFWIGLKPSRFGLLTVLLLAFGLFEPWTGQGQDALQNYAGSAFSHEDLQRRLWLYAMTFCLAILTWFFCRLSSDLRFKDEPVVMHRYRLEFPRAHLTQQQAIDEDTDARVRNILATRKWAPRILGMLIPIVVAAAFLIDVGKAAWLDVVILLVMAAVVGVLVICRRDFQNWLADWFSKRQQPWLGDFLRAREANDTATRWSEISTLAKTALSIVSAFVILCVLLALVWPLEFGRFFGPLPVIMLSLTVILGIGSLLASILARRRQAVLSWSCHCVPIWDCGAVMEGSRCSG